MALYHKIDGALNNKSNVQQYSFMEDVSTTLKFSNKIDIKRTLELLNATNDINLQTKLLSALSASLMLNNNVNFELIIRYSAIYEKVNNVLTKGLPRKAEHALNFLTALLYVDEEEGGPTKRRTLALYAKNMIRVSGCLTTMSDMFTNCMMFHDTWKALCQCLAAVCDGSGLNQSYCSHLIQVCVQRCYQTNIEIFSVLQSLLQNHKRNMELFLNCNGLSIFTRELLHYDKCLQLLMSVVQSPSAAPLLIRQVRILDDLREFLRLYGPSSQIGQKAKIILYHVLLTSQGSDHKTDEACKKPIQPNITNSNKNVDSTQIYEPNENNELDDTATLMQKVMIEVFKYKQSQLASTKQPEPKVMNSFIRSIPSLVSNSNGQRNYRESISNKTTKIMNQQRRNKIQDNDDSEALFLNNINDSLNYDVRHVINKDKPKILDDQNVVQRQSFATANNKTPYSYREISNEKSMSTIDLDFKPALSSTPKRGEFSQLINYSKASERKSYFPSQYQTTLHRTSKVVKRRHNKTQNNEKKVGNMSISLRFVSAINESCTTLVRTVANIFKKNETEDFSKDKTETRASRLEDASCSFSFLKYMQKRDATLHKLKAKSKDYTDFSGATELCETCDTQTLKKKLARNEHLKQTVKKLKLGINLYGCDFKKISRTMWPRDSYMTPSVLYSLYRKLLLK